MSAYINGLLMAVLRPALSSFPLNSTQQVGTKLPSDYTDHLPFVYARATPGGDTRGALQPSPLTRFVTPIQVDVYAQDARDAHRVGDAVITALFSAAAAQMSMADGRLSSVANVSGPTEFPEPDRADGVVRQLITATLTARPPAA